MQAIFAIGKKENFKNLKALKASLPNRHIILFHFNFLCVVLPE